MISTAYIRTMAAYNAETNRRLTGPLRGSPMASGGSRVAPSGARSTARSITSSGATSNGCRASTIGRSLRSRSSERRPHRRLCGAARGARAGRCRHLRWAAKVDDAWLAEDLIWFSGAAHREIRAPRGLLVTHFFNHQTHHRGQVHAMLTAAGQETGDTDLFLIIPEPL